MQQELEQNQSFQRLYINSYTMKVSGNDVDFVVDLGRNYSYQQLSIDMVVLENKFLNQYKTLKGDFADLSFIFTTAVGPTVYNIRADQYLTIDNITAFIAGKTTVNLNITDDGFGKLQFQPIRGGVIPLSITFTGFGWTKLGLFQTAHPVVASIITGDSLYDFAAPPTILISVDQINGNGVIQNQQGQYIFALPNTVGFGERIVYTNTDKSTCNTIFSQQRFSLNMLNIRLQSCDQTMLDTPANSVGELNKNDLELIMVISLR